jgi:hypothetical protein
MAHSSFFISPIIHHNHTHHPSQPYSSFTHRINYSFSNHSLPYSNRGFCRPYPSRGLFLAKIKESKKKNKKKRPSKRRGIPLDAGGAGPVIVALFGGGPMFSNGRFSADMMMIFYFMLLTDLIGCILMYLCRGI